MKYMLIMNETAENFAKRGDRTETNAYWGAWNAYIGAMYQAGIVETGNGLEAPSSGAVITIRDGKRHIQDGPHPDTKEQLGGYFVIDVPDLDTALEWAARSPSASSASVEVRPVMVMS